MIGILYLIAGTIYLSLMFYAIAAGWRVGRRNNGSRARAVGLAIVGFLIVYLPVFWDVVPTAVMHYHHCSKDAGLFVHKDPKAWADEHRRIADSLKIPWAERKAMHSKITEDGWTQMLLNREVADESRHTAASDWLDIERVESRLVDLRTGDIFVLFRDYRAGKQMPNQSIRPQAYLPFCGHSNLLYTYISNFSILEFRE